MWLRKVLDRLRRPPVARTPEIEDAQEALQYMRDRRRQITEARIRADGQRADHRVSQR